MPLKFAAATLAAIALVPGVARATDYVTIPLETTIDAPADTAWQKIDGFCRIGVWFKTTCEITSGQDGQVGAVRRIAGRIDEVIVGHTASSYTYTQPKSPIDYHGTSKSARSMPAMPVCCTRWCMTPTPCPGTRPRTRHRTRPTARGNSPM